MIDAPKAGLGGKRILYFLVLAVIGLTAFGFGGPDGTPYLGIAAFLLALFLIAEDGIGLKGAEAKNFLLWSFPLMVFAAFEVASNFWLGYSWQAIFGSVVSVCGMAGFLLLGLAFRKKAAFDMRTALCFLLDGMALCVLISFIYSMAEYGPFYVYRYAGQEYFYDGSAFLVSEETGWLSGFSFAAVTIRYASAPAFILSAGLPALLFLRPKDGKALFFSALASGLVGLAYLLFLPNETALVMFLVLAVFALLARVFWPARNAPSWERYLGWALLAIIIILVSAMTIIAAIGDDVYAAVPLLAKIFDNGRLTKPINSIIYSVFHSYSSSEGGYVWSWRGFFFGMPPYKGNGGVQASYWGGQETIWPRIDLKTFEFSALMEGGFLAFAGFCAFLVFAILSFRRFLRESDKPNGLRILIFFLALSYALYMSLAASVFPFVRDPYYYVSPFRSNALWMAALFLVGSSYSPIFVKARHEAAPAEEEA